MNYENPFIKVTWEDVPENFTNEKIKRVKSYFQQKYNTKTVRVITKSITNNKDTKLNSLEASDNILDLNHQKKLMQEFIKENSINVDWNKIDRLDSKVNEKIILENQNKVKYNKWFINKIEFSNFLSFGQNNLIDFTDMDGITVVESNPKNFGGKSTATVDLLMFLFFNSTTKTKTNLEIFNKFTDFDEVLVKGFITIDDEDYIIERKLNRKKSKNGEYSVTSKLEFFKITNKEIINLAGEQRRETEAFITSAIGSEEDFLATILTTGYNLEQLIESKPTARGLILTKFMGLDNLKQKEEIAKEIYNEWSKKLVSNSFNIADLEAQIRDNLTAIETQTSDLSNTKILLLQKEKELSELEDKKEKLLLNRNNDIYSSLTKINPVLLTKEINDIEEQIQKTKKIIESIVLIEPKEYFVEEVYDNLKKSYDNLNFEKLSIHQKIKEKEHLVGQLENGTVCPTCKRKLDDVDHTSEIESIKKEIEELKKINFEQKLNQLNEEINKYKEIKNVFDLYEKNKLIKERYLIDIDQKNIEVENKKNKIEEYYKNEKKLEENKRIDSELISLKTSIETLIGEIKIYNNNIIRYENSITQLTERNNSHNELIKKIRVEEDTIQIFKVYFTIFGKNGISKVIMKNMIPVLNNELYRLLVDSCHFILELNINDKNEVEFIMIDTETRVIKPLAAGSGYERTISSLALRSVLTKISSLPKPNVVVMDEVFGKIADENLEMVGEFFKKIKKYFEHIFVISHNPLIRNWSDNVVLIKKDDNVSSIEQITIGIN